MKKAFLLFTLIISFTSVSVFACGMQNQYKTDKAVLSEDEAKQLSLNYLSTIDDKTIKVESVDTKPEYYVVVVTNEEKERVAEIIIDKRTGTERPNF